MNVEIIPITDDKELAELWRHSGVPIVMRLVATVRSLQLENERLKARVAELEFVDQNGDPL